MPTEYKMVGYSKNEKYEVWHETSMIFPLYFVVMYALTTKWKRLSTNLNFKLRLFTYG